MPQSAQSPAAATAEQMMEELFAEWTIKNHNTARYWAAATGGLMGVFVVSHWTRILYGKHFSRRPNALGSIVRTVARPLRRLNAGKSLGSITILPGKFTVALVYLAINAGLTFYDSPQNAPLKTMLSKRFGWVAILNLCLTVFLGLKNTPLSPLAGYSFDSLNILHRCAGYTTILYMILHSTTYISFLFQSGNKAVLADFDEYAGAVAGIAMLLLLSTSIGPIRKRFYELFYASHLLFVTIIIIALGLHRPEYYLKVSIITSIAGSLWFVDKSLRLTRWIYHGLGNYATLQPLANEATKVTIHKSIRAAPGSSAFLWIPGIKTFQRHPFTLVSADPATFVIKSRNGFTRALYNQARKTPKAKFRAAIEGPYGNIPNAHDFDKVVLIAGGSGITFTMSLASDWARRRKTPRDSRTMDFVWCVRDGSCLEWFTEELKELRSNPRVEVRIHTTRDSAQSFETSRLEKSRDSEADDGDQEKKFGVLDTDIAVRPSVSETSSQIRERGVEMGRPNIDACVGRAVRDLGVEQRVLVAACGPKGLLNCIRSAVAKRRVSKAPGIEMYLEEFAF